LAELTVSTLILLFVFIATTPLLFRVPAMPRKTPGARHAGGIPADPARLRGGAGTSVFG
jgi:hypothetical protein